MVNAGRHAIPVPPSAMPIRLFVPRQSNPPPLRQSIIRLMVERVHWGQGAVKPEAEVLGFLEYLFFSVGTLIVASPPLQIVALQLFE